MDAGPRVVVDFIVNGVLNGFVVDHIHMLIPGPEMEGEGLIYYASPNEKYVLRATWTHGVTFITRIFVLHEYLSDYSRNFTYVVHE